MRTGHELAGLREEVPPLALLLEEVDGKQLPNAPGDPGVEGAEAEVLGRQPVRHLLQVAHVPLQVLGGVPRDGGGGGVPDRRPLVLRGLDQVLKLQCQAQQQGLLAGEHLLVDGVVEVRHLLQHDAVAVEPVRVPGRVENAPWDGQAQGHQRPHLPQQRDQGIPKVDAEVAGLEVQLHEPPTLAQAHGSVDLGQGGLRRTGPGAQGFALQGGEGGQHVLAEGDVGIPRRQPGLRDVAHLPHPMGGLPAPQDRGTGQGCTSAANLCRLFGWRGWGWERREGYRVSRQPTSPLPPTLPATLPRMPCVGTAAAPWHSATYQ